MENTTLDMQASLNSKGCIGLFVKEQDKSSSESRHGESTSFVSLLEEKSAQAINDKPEAEKIKENSDCEKMNSDFTEIPTLVPLPLETGHKLSDRTPLSSAEGVKSPPLMDEEQSSILLLQTIMTAKNMSEGMLKPTLPTLNEMTSQSQTLLQHPSGDNSPITIVLGKSTLSSSDNAKPFHSSATPENTTGRPSNRELKPVTAPADGIAAPVSPTGDNSIVFKMVSTSAVEENTSRKTDPSDNIRTLMTPSITATRKDVKLTMPLNTDIEDQVGQAQTANTGREAVFVALGATEEDNTLPKVDFSSSEPVTNHNRPAKSQHRIETESMDDMAKALHQNNDKSAAHSIFSDIRRMTVSHHDSRTDTAAQKEGPYIATVPQKPLPAASDRIAGTGQPVSNDSQVELPDKAVFMKSSPVGTTAADQGDQKIWNIASDRHHRTTNQGEFPLRAEMTNILSTQGSRSSTTHGPAGINTQAVIDQILDAKQALNNGFGRARITLDPPNLGTVNLEIVVRKERVEVVITADNSGVQQALQSRVDDIRTALQRQDLKIETFQVLLQDNTANQHQGNSGATFGQRKEHQARQILMDDSIPVQPLMQPIRESETVRGMVSIFV